MDFLLVPMFKSLFFLTVVLLSSKKGLLNYARWLIKSYSTENKDP